MSQPGTCKTGGFQGIKGKHFNDVQMFGPRLIRIESEQEQEEKLTFKPQSTSSVSPQHDSQVRKARREGFG
jgi:hypothetical protein